MKMTMMIMMPIMTMTMTMMTMMTNRGPTEDGSRLCGTLAVGVQGGEEEREEDVRQQSHLIKLSSNFQRGQLI